MVALLKVPAADVSVEGLEVDFELPPKWLDAALGDGEACALRRNDAPKAGSLKGRLSRSGPADIVVRCRVVAAVETSCARCLEPAAIPVDAELSLLLQPSSRANERRSTSGEYEFTRREADLDVYDGEVVVLDAFVRELILLEIPTFPLCSEACPGIRPRPEEDLPDSAPVDPRMAPLGAYLDDDQQGPVTIDNLVMAAVQRSAALGKKPRLKATTNRQSGDPLLRGGRNPRGKRKKRN